MRQPCLICRKSIRGILQPNLLVNIHKSYILSLLQEFLFRYERGFVDPWAFAIRRDLWRANGGKSCLLVSSNTSFPVGQKPYLPCDYRLLPHCLHILQTTSRVRCGSLQHWGPTVKSPPRACAVSVARLRTNVAMIVLMWNFLFMSMVWWMSLWIAVRGWYGHWWHLLGWGLSLL